MTKLKVNPMTLSKDPQRIAGLFVALTALNLAQYGLWSRVFNTGPSWWLTYSIAAFIIAGLVYLFFCFTEKKK
jgi:hypothetical protein